MTSNQVRLRVTSIPQPARRGDVANPRQSRIWRFCTEILKTAATTDLKNAATAHLKTAATADLKSPRPFQQRHNVVDLDTAQKFSGEQCCGDGFDFCSIGNNKLASRISCRLDIPILDIVFCLKLFDLRNIAAIIRVAKHDGLCQGTGPAAAQLVEHRSENVTTGEVPVQIEHGSDRRTAGAVEIDSIMQPTLMCKDCEMPVKKLGNPLSNFGGKMSKIRKVCRC